MAVALAPLALRALTAARPLREAAIRLELVRTIGLRATVGRRRQETRRKRLGIERRQDALQLWEEAARELGAGVEPLGAGFLRIERGGVQTVVRRHTVALNDPVALKLVQDKAIASRLLREAGLATPPSLCVETSDLRPAIGFLERQAGPCVVKPAGGTDGGMGVTGGVRRPTDLLRAALKASRGSRRVLVERQIVGRVYRVLLLDGEVLDVIERGLPVVTGDARSSVAELMERENERRLTATRGDVGYLLWPDLDTVLALREQGSSLGSVPPAGQRLLVKTVTSQNGAGDNTTYRAALSGNLIDDLQRAVAVTGLRLAGVDVATSDPGRPLDETGGAILEVNGEPGLAHHHTVAEPEAAPHVAVPILRALLDGRSSASAR